MALLLLSSIFFNSSDSFSHVISFLKADPGADIWENLPLDNRFRNLLWRLPRPAELVLVLMEKLSEHELDLPYCKETTGTRLFAVAESVQNQLPEGMRIGQSHLRQILVIDSRRAESLNTWVFFPGGEAVGVESIRIGELSASVWI